jgi:hypothetical protein
MKLFKRKPKPQPKPQPKPGLDVVNSKIPAIMLMDAVKVLNGPTLCKVIWASIDDKHDLHSQDLRLLAQKLDRKADQLERVEAARLTS